MKHNIIIRRATIEDLPGVTSICYSTGYMGKSLKGHFKDEVLFAELFARHYIRRSEELAFVATVNGQVKGYCVGSLDTIRQRKRFRQSQVPLIKRRLLTRTIWFAPRDVITTIRWSRAQQYSDSNILERYPAHLHINIDPSFQGQGIGKQLIEAFRSLARENVVPGIHLRTSSENHAALRFYKKLGFTELQRERATMWHTPGVESVLFAQSL